MAFETDMSGKPPKEYKKEYLEEDNYDGEIVEISDIRREAKYGNPKDDQGNVIMEDKMTIQIKVDKSEKESVNLPMFMKPTIKKGSGDYQSSKLYVVLEKAELLDKWDEEQKRIESIDKEEDRNNAGVNFLKDNLLSKKCRVGVKTVNRNDPEKRYSVVEKIVKFH